MSILVGKVAKVSPPYEVVVNIGTDKGAKVGDVLRVLNDEPVPIPDPDDPNGEPIGHVRETKLYVKLVDVGPRISVAKTFHERKVRIDRPRPYFDIVSSLTSPPEYEWQQETLLGVVVGDIVESTSSNDTDDLSDMRVVGNPTEATEGLNSPPISGSDATNS